MAVFLLHVPVVVVAVLAEMEATALALTPVAAVAVLMAALPAQEMVEMLG
jgi:hypothetical protein